MGNLRLLVGDAIADGPNELWRGRLERPLAATWVLEAVHGGRWWRDARFRRWIAPAGLAGFAFLLIPLLLAIALRRRRALDEARLRFLTEIAHDLRTPLTAVRLHADMLTTGRAPEQKRAGYLETVARESVRLSGLLGNLLDFSRLERGARSFDPEKVAVAKAAAQAACDFQALFPERRNDITWSGPEDLRARADRTALGRCLANLLDNAGKFTPPRTPIEIRWRAKEGKVRIEVSDRGGGIPPAEAKRIFQRYRRGAASRQNGIPGTGLGLSLVRELMRGMEGEVSLAGSGQGAVFVLELPEAGDG